MDRPAKIAALASSVTALLTWPWPIIPPIGSEINVERERATARAGAVVQPDSVVASPAPEFRPSPSDECARAKPFAFADQPERGTTYWDWTPEPIKDEADRVEGLALSLLDVTERGRTEEALQKLAHDLDERVEELRCLHNISSLVETPGISMEEICAGAVELIPPAWQYPEVTCARLIPNGKEYSTANFAHSPWQRTVGIPAHGEQVGSLEVGYLQERPEHDDGPFLREERENC